MQYNLSKKEDVPGLLLVKDLLQFDSFKRPLTISDYSLFAFLVFAQTSFKCIIISGSKAAKTGTYSLPVIYFNYWSWNDKESDRKESGFC